MTDTAVRIETSNVEVPGATIVYDVRPNEDSALTPLMLIGYPMAAAGFVTLASHFTDRTVITYDPRGSERSTKDPSDPVTTPSTVAEDLHAVIQAVGGPVDLFASSGGAVDALALVAEHPSDVRLLVAHEPPVFSVLPDGEQAMAVSRDINETYLRSGFGPAMAKFIALVMYPEQITDEYLARPAPDPAMFHLPTEDDGSRNDPLLTAMVPTNGFEPDFDALNAAPTRIVVGAGEESVGILAYRGAIGVAEQLGVAPVIFPGGHAGFLGGEYGQTEKPTEFAAKLREVLDS